VMALMPFRVMFLKINKSGESPHKKGCSKASFFIEFCRLNKSAV
jgi:hypothetical protein